MASVSTSAEDVAMLSTTGRTNRSRTSRQLGVISWKCHLIQCACVPCIVISHAVARTTKLNYRLFWTGPLHDQQLDVTSYIMH